MNRRGRKIYRASAGNRRRKTQKAFKALIAIIVLAGLVFVGYSVGHSVYKYFSERSENGTADNTAPWTPPVFQEEADVPDDKGSGDNSEKAPAEEEEQTAPKADFSAYQLPETALTSEKELRNALEALKGSGYTAAVVTMKAKGGRIYYRTTSEMALSNEEAVPCDMYAGQIAAMIRNAGFRPIARVNLLEDNSRYGEYKTGSYRFEGTDSTWHDNSVEKGGKPWLSPFDNDTRSFVAFLSNEVSSAGFEYVIFDGVVFPEFRNSDLNYIGQIVKAPDRYRALLNIADIASKAAEANGAGTAVTVSAGDILRNKADVFRPDELTVKTLTVEYFPSEIDKTAMIYGEEMALSELSAYDRAYVVFAEIKRQAGDDIKIIPELRQADFSQADFNETISAMITQGCDSYIILN